MEIATTRAPAYALCWPRTDRQCATSSPRRAVALGIELRLPRTRPRLHPPGTPGRKRRDWPWRGAYVSYDGRAMPSCMIATPDRCNFGSMTEHGVETVWNGLDYERFRQHLSSEQPPEICRSCAIYADTF